MLYFDNPLKFTMPGFRNVMIRGVFERETDYNKKPIEIKL